MRSLRPLPRTRTTPSARVDVAPVEADQLADAQAAGVRDLEEGAVAQAGRRVGASGAVEQAEHVVDGQVVGQRLVGCAAPAMPAVGSTASAPRCSRWRTKRFTAESLRAAELRRLARSRSTRKARTRVAVEGGAAAAASSSPPARAASDWASWLQVARRSCAPCAARRSPPPPGRGGSRRSAACSVRHSVSNRPRGRRFDDRADVWYQPVPAGQESDARRQARRHAAAGMSAAAERCGRGDRPPRRASGAATPASAAAATCTAAATAGFYDPAMTTTSVASRRPSARWTRSGQLLRLLQPRRDRARRRAGRRGARRLDALVRRTGSGCEPRSIGLPRAAALVGVPGQPTRRAARRSVSRRALRAHRSGRGEGVLRRRRARKSRTSNAWSATSRSTRRPAGRTSAIAGEERRRGDDRVAFVYDATVRFDDGGSTALRWLVTARREPTELEGLQLPGVPVTQSVPVTNGLFGSGADGRRACSADCCPACRRFTSPPPRAVRTARPRAAATQLSASGRCAVHRPCSTGRPAISARCRSASASSSCPRACASDHAAHRGRSGGGCASACRCGWRRAVARRRRRARGADLRLRAGREADAMSTAVEIAGVGIHPFGRFGDKSVVDDGRRGGARGVARRRRRPRRLPGRVLRHRLQRRRRRPQGADRARA